MEPVYINTLATGKQEVQTSKGICIKYTLSDDRCTVHLDRTCILYKCEIRELGEFLIKMSEVMDD